MKYGIIYLWFDRKHKRYYIGRHWGNENDGYICSSTWMKSSYNRRKEDFKRRILGRIFTSQEDLIKEEQRWLNMIKPEECGIRYYNKTLRSDAPSMRGRKHTPETIEKIKRSHLGKSKPWLLGKPRSEEWKTWFIKNHHRCNLGKKASNETKRKMSEALRGKPKTEEHIRKSAASRSGQKRSDEAKAKMSEAHKGMKKSWVRGRTHIANPEATREKMKKAALLREQKKRDQKSLLNSSEPILRNRNG